MNGELAQTIALIAHGNAYLHGGTARPILEPANSTFQYVSHVKFSLLSDGHVADIAGNIADWLAWLRSRGVRRLHLRTAQHRGPLPGHIAVSFAGGGRWTIVADGSDGIGHWTPEWAFHSDDAARPWTVRYVGRTAVQGTSFAPPVALDAAREDLERSLIAAEELARAISTDDWREWFEAARRQLSSESPRARYHDDALPRSGYSLACRQVFAAAVGAWVFGGMGSWNDIVVDDVDLNRRYEVVSASLFRSVLNAFEAVLDSDRVER